MKSATTRGLLFQAGRHALWEFGRNDELEADKLAVDFTPKAGYDPRAMIQVMEMLARTGGARSTPEFMSTHPDPGNRIGYLQQEIAAEFPQGVPSGLKK